MFAVLKTGGKQYKVARNDVFLVEKLEAEAGETVRFTEVLMIGGDGGVRIGAPRIEGAAVHAEVLEQTRGPKVVSFKKRRRKHSSQRKRGHRQQLTRVRIIDILGAGAGAEAAAEEEQPLAARAEPEAISAPVAAPAEEIAADETVAVRSNNGETAVPADALETAN